MGRPEDIPQDVWDVATAVALRPIVTGALFTENYVEPVARAILAERERGIAAAEAVRKRLESGRNGKPLNQIDEHVAGVADNIAATIRGRNDNFASVPHRGSVS